MMAEFIAADLDELADDLAAILRHSDSHKEVPKGTYASQAAPTTVSEGQLTIDGCA